MIDFSTLKELYVDGKKVTSLFLDGHEVPFGEEPSKYFTVTALGQPADVVITAGAGTPFAFSLEYSRSADLWSSYSAEQTIALAAGESVMFRRVGSTTTTFSSSSSAYWKFSFSANVKVSGNIMSLIDASMESTTIGAYAFYSLFSGNTNTLIDANELELPSTTLADSCYAFMFFGCFSLSAAPELPATTLADNCYSSMLRGCGISSAPALPATTLALSCYYSMFQDCKSLTSAPELPATTLAGNCYYGLFSGCTALTAGPSVLPAMTLADRCYYSMFLNCYALSSAPELPATTLASNCYTQMFYHCRSLTSAPELPATTLCSYCYNYMFRDCASLSSAPALLPATTLANYCYTYMFQDCTSLTAAPKLSAEKPNKTNCCQNMFKNCSSLSSIEVALTAWGNTSSYTGSWLSGVAATGTFICPSALGTDSTITRGDSYCPTGWTVVNI